MIPQSKLVPSLLVWFRRKPCSPQLKVPSAYFFTDVFIYLDLLLKKRLFKPKAGGDSRQDLAGKQAVITKRMIQGLRYLWRSANSGGHGPRIRELKKHLKPSPRKPPGHAATCSMKLWPKGGKPAIGLGQKSQGCCFSFVWLL